MTSDLRKIISSGFLFFPATRNFAVESPRQIRTQFVIIQTTIVVDECSEETFLDEKQWMGPCSNWNVLCSRIRKNRIPRETFCSVRSFIYIFAASTIIRRSRSDKQVCPNNSILKTERVSCKISRNFSYRTFIVGLLDERTNMLSDRNERAWNFVFLFFFSIYNITRSLLSLAYILPLSPIRNNGNDNRVVHNVL